jgi:hypothetical protein
MQIMQILRGVGFEVAGVNGNGWRDKLSRRSGTESERREKDAG